MSATLRSRTPSIAGLLAFGGPATVAWFVMAVVVDALDRVRGRRLRPHVGEKGREVVAPAIADRDTAATVIGVVVRVLIEAARFHSGPRDILAGLLARARVPMCRRAAAGRRVADPQVCSANRGIAPAVAAADPIGRSRSALGATNGGQQSVSFASVIDCSHRANFTMVIA